MLLVRGEIILAIDIAPDSPRVADLWTVMTRGAGAGEVLDEVIAIAADAMAQARRGGGNQVHYAFDTDLRS